MVPQPEESSRLSDAEHTIVRITPSKADNWQQCAFRFSWQESHGRRHRHQHGDYSAALAMGNATHAMLAEVNHAIMGGATLPEIGETLDQHWNPSHFQTSEDAEDGKRKGATILVNYFAHLRDHHLSVNAFERFVASPAMRINEHVSVILSGKIDAGLDNDDGTVFIEDYKTGPLLPTQHLLSSLLSTTIYHLLGRQLYPDASRIVIGQMQPATSMHVSVELSEDQIKRSKEQIKVMAIAIGTDPTMSGDAFAPVAGEYCSWCPARDNGCPLYDTGRAAGEVAF
jgi:RecB family exonuclease